MATMLSISGFMFILRWLHFFFGIMWIGHLYYFNFTQGSFMAEADAATKSGVTTKLVPRALWWFRWGAMWTMVTGVVYTIITLHLAGQGFEYMYTSTWGIAISTGGLLGLTMWANVWFIIWPNQKVVIKSATQVAGGGAALPEAAGSAAKALLGSRTNTLFSIPMLFFMGAANHLPMALTPDSKIGLYFALFLITWLALQINAIKGQLGPMKTVKGVITSGFVLSAIIYVFMIVSF